MKKFHYINMLSVFLAAFSCVAHGAEEAAPVGSTLERDMGYFYGYSFGNMLRDGGSSDVDVESLLEGLKDSLADNPQALDGDKREKVYAEVTDVDAYSIDQAEQVSRILPIRFCTLPEFYLDEAIDGYIPKDYQEHAESYNVRKTRAMTCFEPFYSHYVDIIVGTALRKGIILPQELTEEWEKFFENANLEGK